MKLLENPKLQDFIKTSNIEKEELLDLFSRIENESIDDLIRINPIFLAEKYLLDKKDVINTFIEASRAGIFDLSWSLICPTCGAVLIQNESINELNSDSHYCSICELNVPVSMDDYVEVVFKFNPDIKFSKLESIDKQSENFNAFFSRSFVRSESLLDYSSDNSLDFAFISPGEIRKFNIRTEKGVLYRLIGINVNKCFYIDTTLDNPESIPLVCIDDNGFSMEEINTCSGDFEIELKNTGNEAMAVSFVSTYRERLKDIFENDPPHFKPFLSGKVLLNNTRFRQLYKIENLTANLKLNLRSLTLLFTDLKGSTEMYDKIGDIAAYSLIQKHFTVLENIVDRYNGAVIKTMGDAIMAAFSTPEDGFLAALDMLEDVKSVNMEDVNSLCLKVGLHEGHALVINRDNQLDYFGQNVNIAARIQGIAGPDEIFMSQSVFDFKGIKQNLLNLKDRLRLYKRITKLKGVGETQTVYKVKLRD